MNPRHTPCPMTLLVHADGHWRRRAVRALRDLGLPAVAGPNADVWLDENNRNGPGCVVVQLARAKVHLAPYVVASLCQRFPGSNVLALGPTGDAGIVLETVGAGARECLPEDIGHHDLAARIRSVICTDVESPAAPPPREAGYDALQAEARLLRSRQAESTLVLMAAVEAKDPSTRWHSLTVARYAEQLARRLALPPEFLQTLRVASLLHDVGKIGVPDAILTKPGPLSPDELRIVRRHPSTALEILRDVRFNAGERSVILHHHERYDGTGYPKGLAGKQIPMGARILAVADAVDTMLSPRTYKRPFSLQRVRRELQAASGRQFDPTVSACALRWLSDPSRLLSQTPERCPA